MATTPFNVTQGHRFFGSNRKLMYDFLLVINTNSPPIMHRFRDIVFNRAKIANLATPVVFHSPDGGVTLGRCP